MRTYSIVGGCVLAGLVAMAPLAGCFKVASDCKNTLKDCEAVASGGSGGAAGSGGSTSVGGAPPGCVPADSSMPVDNSCGVFVSLTLGDDTFNGTKEQPLATITQALATAKGKPIYLCGEPLLEAVKVNGDALIYGGLDCTTDWHYNAMQRSLVDAQEGEITLTLTGQSRVAAFDVDFRSEDAVLLGKSSVTVLAEAETELSLTRSYLLAGSGMTGADGEAYMDTAADGAAGVSGGAACSASTVVTPDPPGNECGDIDSLGGGGGVGQSSAGLPGGPGEPQGSMNGGQGESAAAKCTDGVNGDPGAAGEAGIGANEMGLLQAGIGYVGSPGADGKPGATGQGGGGGGGAKGGTGTGKCTAGGPAGGASGATGGSGGCGGLGGHGGQAGGSSIGIVSLGAKLTLADVVIETKMGGNGGNGSEGQPGGGGGPGGMGGSKGAFINLNNGCAGGQGGVGGQGGQGGGGHGGHSIGIAYKGTQPDASGAVVMPSTAGNGGLGGGPTGQGAPGVSIKTQAFN